MGSNAVIADRKQRGRLGTLGVLAQALALALATSAPATSFAQEAGFCGASPSVPRPQNVILLVLDDSSLPDLPFYNPSVVWPDQDSPPLGGFDEPVLEALTRRPDFNRFTARVQASRDCPAALCPLGPNLLHPLQPDRLVVPIDLDGDLSPLPDTTAESFRYEERGSGINQCREAAGPCDASRDILTGHGGLARMAEEGIVVPRFYAPSSRCSPTRGSIFTGRYPMQVGVVQNGLPLQPSQLTTNDLLARLPGCKDNDDSTACYATGLLGKWHLGANERHGQAPWQRGIQEAVFFRGGSRSHFSDEPLSCSPPPLPANPPAGYRRGYYCTNTSLEAATRGCSADADCDAQCPGGPGHCGCAQGADVVSGDDNFCYQYDPAPCTSDSSCTSGKCLAWGLYLGPGKQTACHPADARANIDCCLPKAKKPTSDTLQGIYPFTDKWLDVQGVAKRFWAADNEIDPATGEIRMPCNDDSSYLESGFSGCRYDTRFNRDWARNFIARHAEQPFFLTIALHAVHAAADAPMRTRAHYRTAGRPTVLPGDTEGVWGALEEVDAAVGNILAQLEQGICNAKSAYDKAGAACLSDADCGSQPGAACINDLASRTLVMLTADQGRPGNSFGNPIYEGGKTTTSDGGIRAGLLAWGPGIGVGSGAPAERLRNDEFVLSQVDILPTVLDAAGCAPNTDDGRYTMNVCQGSPSVRPLACSSNADCVAAGGGTCTSRTLAGRSMLAAMKDAGAPTRDFVFSSYPRQPDALVARGSYYADGCSGNADCAGAAKVCSYRADTPAEPGPASLDRTRIGGSCDVCSNDSDCTGTMCAVNGRFCVHALDQAYLQRCMAEPAGGDLDPIGAECDPSTLRRCTETAPCPLEYSCVQVETPCDRCTDTAWKMLGNTSDSTGAFTPTALYDLASNPEESDASNCLAAAKTPANPDYEPLRATVDDLGRRLNGWSRCVSSSSQADCDTAKTNP